MAYSEELGKRTRQALQRFDDIREHKVFGGLAFMVHGHMYCGIIGDQLMVRVGLEPYEGALSQPHTRQMDFTGRPLNGMVYVTAAGIQREDQLDE